MEGTQSQLGVLRVLWGALVSSMLIIVGVTVLVIEPTSPPDPILLVGLGLTGATVAVVSLVWPRLFFLRLLATMNPKLTDVTDSTGSDVLPYRDTKRRRVFASPDAAARGALTRYQTVFILKMALAESVGIFGLVLCVLGHELTSVAPFFVVALALQLARFPRPASWERPLEAQFGASLR